MDPNLNQNPARLCIKVIEALVAALPHWPCWRSSAGIAERRQSVRSPTLVDGTRTKALASTTEGDRRKADEAEEESKVITDLASTCAFEFVPLRSCSMIEIWPARASELEQTVQTTQELLPHL